jgi:uncharacterized protein YukE
VTANTAVGDLVLDRLRQAREQVEELDRRLDAGRQAAHRLIATLGELLPDVGLGEMVDRGVARAKEANADALATVDEIIESSRRAPEVAAEFARVWNEISAQAHGIGNDVDESKSRIEAHWTGDAANSYLGIVGNQSLAARRVAEIAKQSAAACADMAEAAKVFNLAVLAAVSTYVATVVVALGMIVTVAGIVAGVATLIQAVVSYTTDLIRARDAFFARQDKQATMLIGLAQSPEGFAGRGGTWPQAVKASYSDTSPVEVNRDTSDWTPRV